MSDRSTLNESGSTPRGGDSRVRSMAVVACVKSPPITRTTFPTCRAHYPGGSNGCACRLLPRSYSLPQMAGGSASALSLSRPAQTSLTLRPAGLLNRLKRPLSRGSSPAGHPTEPLVSYQINRQLSGWNLPPLVIRAFGAHCHEETHALQQNFGDFPTRIFARLIALPWKAAVQGPHDADARKHRRPAECVDEDLPVIPRVLGLQYHAK